MEIGTFISLIVSFVALVVSACGIYLQYYKVRRPKIKALVPNDEHRSVLRPYRGLPLSFQQLYPEYKETYPGYALIHLNFGNDGDGTGLVQIKGVNVRNAYEQKEEDKIKASYYNFCPVPPHSIVQHVVVLRNILPVGEELIVDMDLTAEWAWHHPKKGYEIKNSISCPIKVRIIPSKDVVLEFK